jgi:hypothetical protein
VVIVVVPKLSLGSRRLNISRETKTLARLAIVLASLLIHLTSTMTLHVRHCAWDPAHDFLTTT